MKLIIGSLLVALLGSLGVVVLSPAPEPVPTEDPRFAQPRYNAGETDWNDYVWPTDASPDKTSSFCEFRKTHFHAGIDISTNMKRGYNTFASRAGWLHSIEFEPGGYGWFMVLRHYDGYYTCYAHLEGFPEEIERAYVEKLQEMKKSFGRAEWRKDEVKFKKGDVIAFTGATGAGPPHLHFEIRDSDFNPVNPELAPNIRVPDTQPPEFIQIALVPLDPLSSVNGDGDIYIETLRKLDDTLYSMRSTPVLAGRVGVQVRAIDGAEGFKDTETPYRMTATVNGRKHFMVSYDRIQDDHEWYIRIDRNNDLMLSRKGEFRKLYKEPGNTLAVYLPDEPWAGVLSSSESLAGLNALAIRASDHSGNTATLQCNYMMKPEADLSLSAVSTNAVAVASGIDSVASIVEISPYGSKGRTLLTRSLSPGGAPLRWTLPEASDVYTVHAVDSTGHVLQRLYCTRRVSPGGTLTGSYSTVERGLRVQLASTEPMNLPPVVTLRGGAGSVKMKVEGLSPSEYRAMVVIPESVRPPFIIEAQALVGGELKTWKQPVNEVFITPASGGTLYSANEDCRVEFGPSSVLHSGFYRLAETGTEQGTVYTVVPSNVPLTGKIKVFIRPPYRHDGKNYIAARSPSVYMRYGTQEFDANSPWVAGIFGRYPAEYTLRRDTTAPVISIQNRRGRLTLIRITDEGSGVDRQSILIRSGKSIIPVFYNERTSGYEIPAVFAKSSKARSIVVTASDRVGNFSIKDGRL